MKTVVIYKSISGFTKKYAEWIAEELKADLLEYKNTNIDQLRIYDLIIFGGSLHAAGINGVNIIKKNLHILTDKKIIIFTTGASPQREEIFDEIKQNNFTPEEQEKIQFYYFRGGFDYNKLNLPNKILMTLFKWKIQHNRNKSPDEIGMLAAYENPMDFTKKENIDKLLKYANSL